MRIARVAISVLFILSLACVPIGIMVLVGTVGYIDYTVEIGEAVSTLYITKRIATGIVLILLNNVVYKIWVAYKRIVRKRGKKR